MAGANQGALAVTLSPRYITFGSPLCPVRVTQYLNGWPGGNGLIADANVAVADIRADCRPGPFFKIIDDKGGDKLFKLIIFLKYKLGERRPFLTATYAM